MEEENYNGASYGVPQKPQGKNRRLRYILLASYLAFSLAYCLFFTVVIPLVQVIALLPICLLVGISSTWRLVAYDREYEFAHGVLTIRNFYKNKKRREVFHVTVKEASAIRPLTEPLKPCAEYERVYDYRGDLESPDSYLIVFRDKDGRTAAAAFEATRKMVRLMAHYNAATVLSDTLRY